MPSSASYKVGSPNYIKYKAQENKSALNIPQGQGPTAPGSLTGLGAAFDSSGKVVYKPSGTSSNSNIVYGQDLAPAPYAPTQAGQEAYKEKLRYEAQAIAVSDVSSSKKSGGQKQEGYIPEFVDTGGSTLTSKTRYYKEQGSDFYVSDKGVKKTLAEIEAEQAGYTGSAQQAWVTPWDLMLYGSLAKTGLQVGANVLTNVGSRLLPSATETLFTNLGRASLNQSGRIAPSIYNPLSTQIIKEAPKVAGQTLKGGATWLAQHKGLRTALMYAEAPFLSDAYAVIGTTLFPTTTTTKAEETQALEAITASRAEAERLLEFEKDESKKEVNARDVFEQNLRNELKSQGLSQGEIDAKVKQELSPTIFTAPEGYYYPETGTGQYSTPKTFVFEETGLPTMTLTDTQYKPRADVPGIDAPFFGRLSLFDVMPSIGYDVFSGGRYTKETKEGALKTLTEKGWSPEKAQTEIDRLYITQVLARQLGGVHALLNIGVGEELFVSSGTKAVVEGSKQFLKGALTKGEAAKLVTKVVIPQLAVGGFLGGATSVAAEQREKMQDFNPIDIAIGGVMGAGSAVVLGAPIARWGITSPVLSKATYGLASLGDWFEPIADKFTSVARKATGESELMIPIITATPTPSTTTTQDVSLPKVKAQTITGVSYEPIPSITPTPTPTTTNEATNILTGTITPTPIPTFTTTFTPTPTPTPTPITTPIPEPTITPVIEPSYTPVATATSTPTVSSTITATSTFVPTFTATGFPFFPPLGGGSFGTEKKGRRERVKFIDEFSAAFAGLATPNQPVIFGKQKPVELLRKQFKPKKGKSKKQLVRGGVDFGAIERFLA